MTSRRLVGNGVKWSAGVALLLGCSATGSTDPSNASTDDALGRPASHRPAPAPRGPGRPRHAHGPGHPPGHHHPGPGGAGTGGSGSASAGAGNSSSSGNGSGATTSSGGTYAGGAGMFGGGGMNTGVCGDGIPSGYEECDDGNTLAGDGCDASCAVEPGFTCPWSEPCRAVACGDGLTDSYATGDGTWDWEECDDGNTTSGDGCSATCEPESGYICDQPGQPCRQPRCGDGYIDFVPGRDGTGGMAGSGAQYASAGFAGGVTTGSYEECDDANVTSGDGCSESCFIEPGYSCPASGQPCKLAVCGDGIVDYPSEDCDDGNTTSGDFCSSTCHYEYGSGGIGSGGFTGVGGGVTAGSFSTGGNLPQGGRSSRGG